MMLDAIAYGYDDLLTALKLCCMQEVGFCHMRISDGVNSRLQLSGLLAKLCKVTLKSQ